MQSSFFSDKKRIALVTFIAVILVAAGIAIILVPFYEELNVGFTIQNLAIRDDSMELTVEVVNPGFQPKYVDFNITSQNTDPLLFGNLKTTIAGGSAETLTVLLNLPNPVIFPEVLTFQLDVLVQNRTRLQHLLNASYSLPEFGSNSWSIQQSRFSTQKGDPWIVVLWLDLSKDNFSSAVIRSSYQIQPPQGDTGFLGWPDPLVGYNPLQKNISLPQFHRLGGYSLVQLDIGPFFYDTIQSNYYAFNTFKSNRSATYHLDAVTFSISKGNNVFLNQTVVIDEVLSLNQDIGKHAVLSAVLVDTPFYDEYGDLEAFFSGLEGVALNYTNEARTITDIFNLTFPALPLNWTVPDPASVGYMLNDLPELMKDSLNLSQNWQTRKGTDWKNHGFDLAAGVSGKQHQGAKIAGMTYLHSNRLIVFGGWFESTFVQRSFDLGTMRRAFLHEFFHTLGVPHNDEPFCIMGVIGGWILHPTTHQLVVENIGQYDGV
ncbi:MAG: hypothetical protein ACFFDI_30075 [Promethearchaeota archaeon]